MFKFRAPYRPALMIFLKTECWFAALALLPGAIYALKDDLVTGISVFLVCFFVPFPFMLNAFWSYLYPKPQE